MNSAAIDDPGYINSFAQIVRRHPPVRFASFYNGTPAGPYDLRRKPRSPAAYQRYIVPLGRY